MTDFESMYYSLISRIADVQEFLSCIEEKDEVIADTEQILCNIITSSEETYISGNEICMAF